MSEDIRLFANAVLTLLLRTDVLAEDDVAAMADELDKRATREYPDIAEQHRTAAHLLRCALLDPGPPSDIDPEVQTQAEFRRKQIRLRTAMIERDPNALERKTPAAEDRGAPD